MRLMRSSITIFLAILATLLTGCFNDKKNELILFDNLFAEYQSAFATHQAINNFESAPSPPSSIFLNRKVINDQLNILEEISLELKEPPAGFAEAYITIDKVKLVSRDGYMPLEIDLTVRDDNKKLSLGVEAEGALAFDRYGSVNPDGLQTAIFKIRLAKLNLKFGFWFFRFKDAGYLSDWLLEVATDHLNKPENELLVALPLEIPFKWDTSVNEKQTMLLSEELGSQSSATFNLHSVGKVIERKLDVSIPIITKEGLFLTVGDYPSLELPPLDSNAEATEIKQALTELKKSIDDSKNILTFSDRDILVDIDTGFLESVVKEFNSISAADRNIQLSIERGGQRVFKDADTYIDIKNTDGITGEIAIDDIELAWKDGQMTFSSLARLRATIKTHAHLAFGTIGGGIGHDSNLTTKANASIDGAISVKKVKVGDYDAFILEPSLICDRVKLSAIDNGELDVGIKTEILIGDTPIDPSLIISTIPSIVPLDEMTNSNESIKAVADFSAIQHTAVLQKIGMDQQRIKMDLDVETTLLNTAPDDNTAKLALMALNDGLKNISPSSQCPGISNPEFTILGFDFGENNDLIKFAAQLIGGGGELAEQLKDLASDTLKNGDEVGKKAIEDLNRELESAGQTIITETNRTLQNPGEAVERAGEEIERSIRCVFGC